MGLEIRGGTDKAYRRVADNDELSAMSRFGDLLVEVCLIG